VLDATCCWPDRLARRALTVHEGATVYAQSGIGGDVDAGARISGSPRLARRNGWRRHGVPKTAGNAAQNQELKKKVDELEKR